MNYTYYFKHISKIFLRIGTFFLILGSLVSCGQTEDQVTVNATIFYINETNETVSIIGDCGFDEGLINTNLLIPAYDTLEVHISGRDVMIPPKPTIDNFYIFIGSCFAVYGDSLKCERELNSGFLNILNYTDRKKTANNTFEFTFTFTEETMAEASECL